MKDHRSTVFDQILLENDNQGANYRLLALTWCAAFWIVVISNLHIL
jgi:hypothetical protein